MSTDLLGSPFLGEGRTLIDDLLDEQQLLTPVGKFARQHEPREAPAQAKYYRDLIPLTAPAPGQQYAFAVDLDACTGCKACVTACHSLNGLDEEETWRDVGVLFGGTVAEPVQQTITTACHHSLDPACLNGCPVNAYVNRAPVHQMVHLLSGFILLIATGKLLWELSVYRHLHDAGWTTMKRTALLMTGQLKSEVLVRSPSQSAGSSG